MTRRVPHSKMNHLLCFVMSKATIKSKKGEPITIDAKRFESSAQASARGIVKSIALGQAEPSTEIKRFVKRTPNIRQPNYETTAADVCHRAMHRLAFGDMEFPYTCLVQKNACFCTIITDICNQTNWARFVPPGPCGIRHGWHSQCNSRILSNPIRSVAGALSLPYRL